MFLELALAAARVVLRKYMRDVELFWDILRVCGLKNCQIFAFEC